MDTLAKIKSYQDEIQYHRLQAEHFLAILNNNRSPIYIGNVPPNLIKGPRFSMIFNTDEHYNKLKQFITELVDYHWERQLWYKQQIKELQQQEHTLRVQQSIGRQPGPLCPGISI